MDSNVYTILLCGVGGQGTITAADLLARVATAAGLDCKVSEIHGMAQRGGAVTTVVRFGDNVSTMVCDEGCADSVVSFEIVEALRNISFLKTSGSLVVNDESIK
ncbi:MAG: 2-oxoacid:acceptor oxidoreductase family protein, partial [Eggerthellaceae bacterium]|nr:2-oxoacid:acceptor oxidoreductase family protein [Eggerthellaceae bacterium]